MSRWRVTFWLDDEKESDWAVGQSIRALKLERKFVGTVRDGIRLIVDLRAGRTDTLFSMFPWLLDTLKPTPAPPSPTDTGALERKIEQLQSIVLAQGAGSPNGQVMSGLQPALPMGGTGNLKLGGGKSMDIAMPTFDDDDMPTVVIKRAETDYSAFNQGIVDRMFSMQASLGSNEPTDPRIGIREFKKHGAGL